MADVEIKNPELAATEVKKKIEKAIPAAPLKQVPYPSDEAEAACKRINGGARNEELERILFAIERERSQGFNTLKVRGTITDKTEHSLFASGFRMNHGFEEKPKYMMQGQSNVEPFDQNKPFTTIKWI